MSEATNTSRPKKPAAVTGHTFKQGTAAHTALLKSAGLAPATAVTKKPIVTKWRQAAPALSRGPTLPPETYNVYGDTTRTTRPRTGRRGSGRGGRRRKSGRKAPRRENLLCPKLVEEEDSRCS
jgi:hypothetical protein